jgi:hypothetical protein
MTSVANLLVTDTDDEAGHLIPAELTYEKTDQRTLQPQYVDEETGEPASRSRVPRFTLAMIAVGLVGVIAVLSTRNGAADDLFEADAAIQFSTHTGHLRASCTKGNQDWTSVSTSEIATQDAIEKALHFAALERVNCDLASFAGFDDPTKFFYGANHTHTVHAQQKFDKYCDSETYKLSFHIAPSTTFRMQVNKDFGTGAWSLLQGSADPPICKIRMGSASSTEYLHPEKGFVQRSAKYAATELAHQQQLKNCLPPSGAYEVKKVLSAAGQIIAGLRLTLKVELTSGISSGHAILIVVEKCGKYMGSCVRQLILEDSNPCTPFMSEDRRLEMEGDVVNGLITQDPTEIWAEQRRLLTHPRELSSSQKAPLMTRWIKSGSVPSSYDPRSATCTQKVAVYDQGVCGSCYANAVAQMHGIRLCYSEKGGKPSGRRLDAEQSEEDVVDADQDGEHTEEEQPLETQEEEDKREGSAEELPLTDANADEKARRLASLRSCMGSWSWAGYKCSDSKSYCTSYPKIKTCCPGLCTTGAPSLTKCMGSSTWSGYTCANAKKYCSRYPKLSTCCPNMCGGGSLSTCMGSSSWSGYTCSNSKSYCGKYSKLKTCCPGMCSSSGCLDSTTWNYGGRYCSWFKSNDKGCKNYRDYGQKTHCKQTCNTCPQGNHGGSNSANPWYGAWYQYMPSVGQIGPCAKSADGTISGCSGGSLTTVWNNWMRDWNANLYRMGQSCLPYKYKCWSSKGVVNPMSSGSCSKYNSYQQWHRPCNCIPSRVKPSRYTCPRSAPAKSCSVPPPPRMFLLKSMAHGLTNAQTVLNMQRHIVEFGPIYVAFSVTRSFMKWNWKSRPVYTGGSGAAGGHAVVLTGWGRQGYDYWLMRNSWGKNWAEGGYCKFQRGVNRDKIESTEIGASMPTSNFRDWSGPVCVLKRWNLPYTYRGSKLESYSMKMKVSCNKYATLKIFVSNRITNKKAIYSSVSGNYYNKVVSTPNREVVMPTVSLLGKNFGLRNGMAWVQIQATDRSGNKEKTSNFVTLNAIRGMRSTR